MIHRSAVLSADRRYRFDLVRRWSDGGRRFVVIGLNPSTANETVDDPTIRRCVGFAKQASCHELVMLNLFAFRATDPRELKLAADPVGAMNDSTILQYVAPRTWPREIVVAAWGVHGRWHDRDQQVRRLIANTGCVLYHFGLTVGGHPRHPLYLPAMTPLLPWSVDA